MKKIGAGILAVILTMSMMTSCGTTNQGDYVESDTTSQINNGNDDNDTQTKEQTTKQDTDEPSIDTEISTNDSEPSYEIIKKVDFDEISEEDYEHYDIYTDEEVHELVRMVIEEEQAIINNDKQTFENIINLPLLIKIEEETFQNVDLFYIIDKENVLSDNEFNRYINETQYVNFNFDCDLKNISSVYIGYNYSASHAYPYFKIEIESDAGTILLFATPYRYNNEKSVVIEQCILLGDYETTEELHLANSNAKTAYNLVAEYLEEHNIDFADIGEDREIDLNAVGSDNFEKNLIDYFKSDEPQISMLYVGELYYGSMGIDSNFFVQCKSAYDPDIIGQYPTPAEKISEVFNMKWGIYYNYEE